MGPLKKIILADDDTDITKLLEKLLKGEGYQVVAVNDGQAAMDAYHREKPGLLILDVSMPYKDGMTVCQEIRREDPLVLILMLTGQKTEKDKLAGLGKGADEYMTKPFGSRELLARIRSLFRRLER
jgi:two-component system response regulator VicR